MRPKEVPIPIYAPDAQMETPFDLLAIWEEIHAGQSTEPSRLA